MGYWTGGFTQYERGVYVRVPMRVGPALRQFFGYSSYGEDKEMTHRAAEIWQNRRGEETWGSHWPTVKKNGRLNGVTKTKQIEPGIIDIVRLKITKTGNVFYERYIRVSYQSNRSGKVQAVHKTFNYSVSNPIPKRSRSRQSAIEQAKAFRQSRIEKYPDINVKAVSKTSKFEELNYEPS